jgi:hypothetical protein
MSWRFALIAGVSLALQGCQALSLPSGDRGMPEVRFDNLWWSYAECRLSQDAAESQALAANLSEAALGHAAESRAAVPEGWGRYVSPMPSRLSVDPMAMAAACTLHAGDVARRAGRPALASELYELVVRRFQEPACLFYVNEARAALVLGADNHLPAPPIRLTSGR